MRTTTRTETPTETTITRGKSELAASPVSSKRMNGEKIQGVQKREGYVLVTTGIELEGGIHANAQSLIDAM